MKMAGENTAGRTIHADRTSEVRACETRAVTVALNVTIRTAAEQVRRRWFRKDAANSPRAWQLLGSKIGKRCIGFSSGRKDRLPRAGPD